MAASAADTSLEQTSTFANWISTMKQAPRGPFKRIRWFCADGEILPPEPYACRPHGGGFQHGEWTDQVKLLRASGYHVANILAGIDVEAFMQAADSKNIFNQMLIEQFLIQLDDGWIWRKARFYRGARQDEAERDGAWRLLLGLLADPTWQSRDFLVLRNGANLLNHGTATLSAAQVRELSSELASLNPAFETLRNKIHCYPEFEDAKRVRNFAEGLDDAERRRFLELADLIERLHKDSQAIKRLLRLKSAKPMIANLARSGAQQLNAADTPQDRFMISAKLMAKLREMFTARMPPTQRLTLLDASLALETTHFTAASELRNELSLASRQQQLDWVQSSIEAIYGAGLISQRQREALAGSSQGLHGGSIDLHSYQWTLNYLSLTSDWAQEQLDYHFGASMQRLAELEPKAGLFIQSRLRASPLLFFAQVIDRLTQDVNHLAGIRKELFGRDTGSGLRGLNPGLARGILHTRPIGGAHPPDSNGIYLLPETTAQLFPVAGILTAGPGNRLSHVQLLARNLGIPNVAVNEELLPQLRQADGQHVLLAVSASGSVRLQQIEQAPVREDQPEVLIVPDLQKLDLRNQTFIPLSQLKADDSGRLAGPKSSKLAELKRQFPEAVADGLVIPFGIFRQLLEQPFDKTGRSVFEWMVEEYRFLAQLPAGSPEQKQETEIFRSRLAEWVLHADPGELFREGLRAAMQKVFGPDGSYGVFVRSDTNVEDLPGFTGAGLNLTLPNVVGHEAILKAISRVWASPFTPRAFAWRQARMQQPEHVYPAILLMRSVPVEKSGVMVTQDIDSGDRRWLSVAVNEGVGGVVDGQAAESLRINLDTGEVRLMSQATATQQRVIEAAGGISNKPASGADRLLSKAEIQQLMDLAHDTAQRLPQTIDARGLPAPADIEFGFVQGRLQLFQIRPFLESASARASEFLIDLDAGLEDLHRVKVDLSLAPGDEW